MTLQVGINSSYGEASRICAAMTAAFLQLERKRGGKACIEGFRYACIVQPHFVILLLNYNGSRAHEEWL